MGVDILNVLKCALNVSDIIVDIVEKIPSVHTFVYKRNIGKFSVVGIGEIEGHFVWDRLLYNEITFDYIDESNKLRCVSLFTSRDNSETNDVWNKLIEKYGI